MATARWRPVGAALAIAAAAAAAREAPAEEETVETYPSVTLTNGALSALVYLPDAERGYYRGVRFDGAGVVAQVACAGHTFFGTLRAKHDPHGHDHIAGPADEFDMESPPGFAEAATNGTFLKIGVGMLRKTAERYSFSRPWPLARAPAWDVRPEPSRIVFVQTLADESGWGYRYRKTVELAAGVPRMTIRRELANTGARAFETEQYNHNFISIDGAPVGPDYEVELGFAPTNALPEKLRSRGEWRGATLAFLEELQKGAFWTPVGGFGPGIPDNRFTVRHRPSGCAVGSVTDRPLSKFCIFAERAALCPEPFVRIRLAPGESATWSTDYLFAVPPAR